MKSGKTERTGSIETRSKVQTVLTEVTVFLEATPPTVARELGELKNILNTLEGLVGVQRYEQIERLKRVVVALIEKFEQAQPEEQHFLQELMPKIGFEVYPELGLLKKNFYLTPSKVRKSARRVLVY